MDIMSDMAHLYDDAKFNDECVKLDVKNRLETKQQNRRESMGLASTSLILDRQKALVRKEHNREIKLIKNGLQDIYVRTPYFQTFWQLNEEDAKQAVIDRLVGKQRKSMKRDILSIETVPEDDVMDIRHKSNVSKWQVDSLTHKRIPVRRAKSEPVSSRQECLTSDSNKSSQPGRLRSSSLSALLGIEKHRRIPSSSDSSTCIFPRIESRYSSNKESLRYDPVTLPKSTPKRISPVTSDQNATESNIKTRAHGYVRAAKFHSKSLDRVYLKRSSSHNLQEEQPVETGLEYSELPDNPVLRAHFISQVNSKRLTADDYDSA